MTALTLNTSAQAGVDSAHSAQEPKTSLDWLQAGHTAVITGGANGIGRAAAEVFLANGMQVVIADNNAEALAAAAEDLHAYQDRFEVMICDVSSYAQVCRLRNLAFERFSCVDCLMNNAGAAVTRALPWDDLDGWKKQLDINLWGIVHGCHAFVPALIAQERAATIINTGSKQGITNPPGGYAYNLSKAGVLNYTQSLAHALRDQPDASITAHLLVPGFTYSNMIRRFMPTQPSVAWSTHQVIDFMLDSLTTGDFLILCPDNDTDRTLDEKRIQWHADDLILNRPALSRWHQEYQAAYEQFIDQ
jgi:NAD(P)-dependent dehydrogenase (short-subunit alcohol dehydrogenase family)